MWFLQEMLKTIDLTHFWSKFSFMKGSVTPSFFAPNSFSTHMYIEVKRRISQSMADSKMTSYLNGNALGATGPQGPFNNYVDMIFTLFHYHRVNIFTTNNLFVTSKNETTNLKCCIKARQTFKTPLMVYYFLFITLKTF